jgi:N-acyl-D-aspartate/D-glutamate deacylase
MGEEARARGVDVTFDQYPYNALSTGLGALMPQWCAAGGKEQFLARLGDSATRARIKKEIEEGTADWASYVKGVGWDNVLIARCPPFPEVEGKTVGQLAKENGKDAYEYAFDLLKAADLNVSNIVFAMSEDDVDQVMVHPLVMPGSDGSGLSVYGPLGKGVPHPRNYGTFARILGKYVREKRIMSLEEAVRKMTALPAARAGVSGRGGIKAGFFADVTVFDPDTIKDMATFTNPHQYASGIEWVLVNGRIVVEKNQHTGLTPGMILRRG